ncbi:MAG: NTP transferase domain-containing protein [Lachnospiraceae bacterium]|nr:NTP transferase domain-containing protein [Lachnospiraceae bacterium]
MKISHIGGLIAAAGKRKAAPLLQVGQISIIKRIVITFQQAGIFPIVVVTGAEEDEVKYQLSKYGVIFVQDENCEYSELFDSIKIGLNYLRGKCDRVFFTPVNAPMFMPGTLLQLMKADGPIIVPSYQGRSGHPILFSDAIIPAVCSFNGSGGLRSAIASLDNVRQFVPVEDCGVLMTVHNIDQLNQRLAQHSHALLHPTLDISLRKERSFFNPRVKLLLYLIMDTCSVRKACDKMALSYGKAWNMLNELETEIGYPVVERKQGGSRGGATRLTARGLKFLKTWQQFEDRVFLYCQTEFNALFWAQDIL